MSNILLTVWGVVRRITGRLWRAITSGGTWQEIHVSQTHHSESTLRRYQYLHSHGIKCHIRSLPSPSGRGVSTGMVSLRVHKEDLNKAYHLLASIRDNEPIA